MAPVAVIEPAVSKFAPVTLPEELIAPEFKLVKVPTDVTLVCAAVDNVPVKLVALTLPPVMLPVALINPAVNKFAPVTLPLELMAPELSDVNVPTLVMFACAAVVNEPAKLVADTLPPVMLPVAEINPAVRILPPCMLPVTVTRLAVLSNVKPALPAMVSKSPSMCWASQAVKL